MQVRAIRSDEIEAARLLLAANDWGPRVCDPRRFAELVQRSLALVAVTDGQVVGFLRAITDDLFNGDLSMIVVAAPHRRQGVGTLLVQAAIGDRPQMTWVLRSADSGASAFYEKLGFVRDPADPNLLDPAFDRGDGIYPSPAGYYRMGKAVDLDLLAGGKPRPTR